LLGVALSGAALALPQKSAPVEHVASDSTTHRQLPTVLEQHTCNTAQPAATTARPSRAADDWRVLVAQLLAVYALSFGLLRALFAPAATRQRTALG
jgi:hypothetical protein